MPMTTQENNHQKFIPPGLKTVLAALLSLFLLSLIFSEILESKEKLKSKQTISVSGEGKAIGIPDVALINFSVVTEKTTAQEAMSENAKEMNEIIKFIKESGVEDKDITTKQYYLSPRYDWIEGKRVFRGYELTSTLSVKIRNLDKISSIIDGAVSRGANQVEDIQFVIDEPEKLKGEARAKAIENAKERAKNIAEATEMKIGKIVSFSESAGIENYPFPYYLESKEAIGGVGEAPQIEEGSREIKVNVSLMFEVK